MKIVPQISRTFWQTLAVSMTAMALFQYLGYTLALDILCERLDEIYRAAQLNDGWVQIELNQE